MSLNFLRKPASCRFFLSLGFFWVFALCFPSSICSKPVDESNNNLFDVDLRVELSSCGKKRTKRVQVEFICEDLTHFCVKANSKVHKQDGPPG